MPVAEACAEFVRLFQDGEGANSPSKPERPIRQMMFAWCSTRLAGHEHPSSHGWVPH